MKKYLHIIVIVAILSIAAVLGGVSYTTLAQWTPAPANPPNCPANVVGCNAPINVGAADQSRTGWLGLKRVSITDNFQFATTSAGANKFLMSDATGNATWTSVTPGGGGGGPIGNITTGSGGNIALNCAYRSYPLVTLTPNGSSLDITCSHYNGTAPYALGSINFPAGVTVSGSPIILGGNLYMGHHYTVIGNGSEITFFRNAGSWGQTTPINLVGSISVSGAKVNGYVSFYTWFDGEQEALQGNGSIIVSKNVIMLAGTAGLFSYGPLGYLTFSN